ncbi:MAG: hypothetical protein QOJ81_957 [Chloroflexota bacterium]|nr:hypothetical protein [Chloroflexota bacterium]
MQEVTGSSPVSPTTLVSQASACGAVPAMAGQAETDRGERLTDRRVLLGWNGQDLWLVIGMLGHEHESGRTLALDVELNSAQAFERDIKVRPIRPADYRHPSVGDHKARLHGECFDLNLFVTIKQLPNEIICHRIQPR